MNKVEVNKLKMKNAELKVEVEEYRADLGAMQNKIVEMGEHNHSNDGGAAPKQ